MKIGFSACLLGEQCNFNGRDLLSNFVNGLKQVSQIEFVQFCPEPIYQHLQELLRPVMHKGLDFPGPGWVHSLHIARRRSPHGSL